MLELLVVLAILGLLIALVGPAVMRQFGGAKEKVAAQSVARLASVLDLYKLDVGIYPTTDQGLKALVEQPANVKNWHGPYVKDDAVPEDPWNNAYVYRNPSNRPKHDFDLCSMGPPAESGSANAADTQICNP